MVLKSASKRPCSPAFFFRISGTQYSGFFTAIEFLPFWAKFPCPKSPGICLWPSFFAPHLKLQEIKTSAAAVSRDQILPSIQGYFSLLLVPILIFFVSFSTIFLKHISSFFRLRPFRLPWLHPDLLRYPGSDQAVFFCRLLANSCHHLYGQFSNLYNLADDPRATAPPFTLTDIPDQNPNDRMTSQSLGQQSLI